MKEPMRHLLPNGIIPSTAREMTESVDEPPRKKLRKGTHSCWECRRRKIRCKYEPEDDSICIGCRQAKTKCQSQEEVVDETFHPNRIGGIADRVGRLENLLEAVIRKIDSVNERLDNASNVSHPPGQVTQSLCIDVITPCSRPGDANETVPLLSLFDNDIFDRRTAEGEASGVNGAALHQKHASNSLSKTSTSKRENQFNELRRSLLSVMPSQQDIKKILLATETWWSVWFDGFSDSQPEDARSAWMSLCFSSLNTSHPSFIARALLLVATSLQQLPSSYDYSELSLPLSPQDLMGKYLSQTSALVTSNDELVGSLEGLECLVLQGVCYSNGGKPRRAWLCFRRALDVAQLMGLHRRLKPSEKELEGAPMERFRHIWWVAFQADRYSALILGLPYGMSNQHCDFEPHNIAEQHISKEEIYKRKLAIITGDIIDRNQASKSPGFTATQEIDEKLERLARSMPDSWWETPSAPWPIEPQILARLDSRLMAHFWHYQLEATLHLPFMLRSATDPRFEYNKSICLKASREMIRRYVLLREQLMTSAFVCKIIDFQAFTAVVILLLNLLGPQSPSIHPHSLPTNNATTHDWGVVERVVTLLSDPAAEIDKAVATQGIKVIKTLSAIATGSTANSQTSTTTGAMKLAIPYFGTISIARGHKFQQHCHSQDPAAAAAAAATTTAAAQHTPSRPNLDWRLIYPDASSRMPTAQPVQPPPPPQRQQNDFLPEDSFHIEFSPNGVATQMAPVAMVDMNAISSQGFGFSPEDEMLMMQKFFELDQNVGENWNFSLEGTIDLMNA